MRIQWKGKPDNYDAVGVDRLWFNDTGSRVHYTYGRDDRHVYDARTRDIARILAGDTTPATPVTT